MVLGGQSAGRCHRLSVLAVPLGQLEHLVSGAGERLGAVDTAASGEQAAEAARKADKNQGA